MSNKRFTTNNNAQRQTRKVIQPRAQAVFEYVQKYIPQDPPTIKSNPKRDIILVIELDGSAEGASINITGTDLQSACQVQLGYTPHSIVPRSIKTWAEGGASNSLRLSRSNGALEYITGTDNGSYSQRARVGIVIPPYRQQVISTGTIVAIVSSTVSTTTHIACTTWGKYTESSLVSNLIPTGRSSTGRRLPGS